MATMITSECINCGACEPECPNTAIYQGGVEWELNGATHPAISSDIFYIVPEKCTECVGFYDHEACAAVCPVDCCIPNPEIPETEDVLIARAKTLHPDEPFAADFPSRFRKEGGAPAAEAPKSAEPAAKPAAAAPVAPPPAAAAKPAAAAAPAAAAVAVGRVERPITPPKPSVKLISGARPEKPFEGELPLAFEDAVQQLGGSPSMSSRGLKWLLALGMPLLGALPFGQKKTIEGAVGDRRFFSAAGATGLNVLHNMLIYPIVFAVVGALTMERAVFSHQLDSLIFLGVALASLEAVWRMREGILHAKPAEEVVYRASVYGPPLAAAFSPLVKLLGRAATRGTVAVDGFSAPQFEEKLERERRYGEVYQLIDHANGYLLRMELPRHLPPSAEKETLGLPDEMPDYKIDLSLQNGYFIVKGKVVDPNLRRVAAVSPAFPPDFTTHIKLSRRVTAFRHRYQDKTLEVVLLSMA